MSTVVDLHMHSINSDGTLSAEEMLNMMNELNVDFASITDHDNVKVYEQIKKNQC